MASTWYSRICLPVVRSVYSNTKLFGKSFSLPAFPSFSSLIASSVGSCIYRYNSSSHLKYFLTKAALWATFSAFLCQSVKYVFVCSLNTNPAAAIDRHAVLCEMVESFIDAKKSLYDTGVAFVSMHSCTIMVCISGSNVVLRYIRADSVVRVLRFSFAEHSNFTFASGM